MKQLTFGEIIGFASKLLKEGITMEEMVKFPVYIGNDDELNGIHCAWCADCLDANDTENEGNMDLVEMINERRCNVKLEGKAILIS